MIQLNDIDKVYRTTRMETKALSGIQLDVREGEFISIMGPSGCGKSTLLNVMGLLDEPSQGEVVLDGEKITSFQDRKLARLRNEKIGFVFQSFHSIPDLDVVGNVEIPLLYRRPGLSSLKRRDEALEALEAVGLSSRLHHFPNELSGGQQQRVAVARALVGRPKVILADEPTGNLDSQMGEEIMSILTRLNQEGATVVMVTHDAQLAELTERTVRLFDGRQIKLRDTTMLKNYIVMALKVLQRRKFFTFAGLFGISFTLCVLMVATSFLDHVFAPRSPESDLDRLLYVNRMRMQGGGSTSTSNPGFGFLDEHLRDLPGAEMVSISTEDALVASYQAGAKHELRRKRTDGDYWRIFDFRFVEGGPFTEDDNRNANPVAVINVSTRAKLFGGGNALGENLRLDGQNFRIVGVVEDVSLFRRVPYSDVWVPITTEKTAAYRDRIMGGFNGVILARSRADFAGIKSELQSRVDSVDLALYESYETLTVGAFTLEEWISREFTSEFDEQPHVWAFRGAVAFAALLFMLLPSLNLVNLNLSRTLERSSEIGVRRAFGAARGSLLVQFLVENVIVTVAGGLIGFGLAVIVLQLLNSSQLSQYLEFGINLRVFAWGLMLAVVFGVISGIYPAWRMSRLSPVAALRSRGVR